MRPSYFPLHVSALVVAALLLLAGTLCASSVVMQDGTPYEGVVTFAGNDFITVSNQGVPRQVALRDIKEVHIETLSAESHGLRGEYFQTMDFKVLKADRVDPNLDFSWNGTDVVVADLPSESFTARWNGWLVPRYTEEYTLKVYVDDFLKLWIDDQLVIDHWNKQWGEDSGKVKLIAGHRHIIRVEYANTSGPGAIKLSWVSASQSEEVIPQSAFWTTTVLNRTNGLRGDYYEGQNFEKLVATRLDPQIQFSWDNLPPLQQLGHDNYSVRWRGFVRVPKTGRYTFFLKSDDGSRLWIGGRKEWTIDNWGNHAMEEKSCIVDMKAETPLSIRIDYFQDSNGAGCELWYQREGGEKEIVPQSVLIPLEHRTPLGPQEFRDSTLPPPPAAPANGWQATSGFFAGVCLTDGTMLPGHVKSTPDGWTLRRPDGSELTIASARIAALVPSDIPADSLESMPRDKTGVLLSTGDFSEGTATFVPPNKVQLDSVIFGPMTLGLMREASAVALHPVDANLPPYVVGANDGTVYSATALHIDDGTLTFTNPTLGPLTLSVREVALIRAVK